MAVGPITTPATWLNGTIGQSSWFQNIEDTVNALYAFKSTTYSLWVPASMMQPITGSWNLASGSTAAKDYQATGANAELELAIPLGFYAGSTTQFQRLSSVAVKVSAASASTIQVKVWAIAGMTTSSSPTGTQQGSTANSSGTGYQQVIVSGLSIGPTTDQYVTTTVTSAANLDRVQGALITYTNGLL